MVTTVYTFFPPSIKEESVFADIIKNILTENTVAVALNYKIKFFCQMQLD